jgi:hypothetical protein
MKAKLLFTILKLALTCVGGATADLLNGFVGRAFGIGPIITYSTKIGKSHLDLNARWIQLHRKFEILIVQSNS